VRPPVDVVIPFHGSRAGLDDVLRRLGRLALGPGDTVTIVDNTPFGVCTRPNATSRIDIVQAPEQQSSYYARNRGAERGSGEWLLFIDADVDPSPDMIDRYMTPLPAECTAILAGAVADKAPPEADRETLAGRYARLRRLMDQENTLRQVLPYAKTANCAVRRSALEAVGGFHEGIRSGGDAELCFRLYEAGWQLERRPEALVGHRLRRRLIDLLGQRARHGSGSEWLEQKYPGFVGPRRRWLGVGKDIAVGGVTWIALLLRGKSDLALLSLLDPLSNAAFEAGRRIPNLPWREQSRVLRIAASLAPRRFGAWWGLHLRCGSTERGSG
jgi:hypothetical protein